MARLPRLHPDLVAALGLTVLPFLVLGRALFPGRVLSPADNLLAFFPWKSVAPEALPHNPLVTDVTAMFHPWAIYVSREIGEGRIPLWNPHIFLGAPFFANPQTALLFPLTWLGLLLPAPLAISLGAILRISLAGLSMYWFLRFLVTSRRAAVVGAVAYMFNAVLMVWLHWSASTALAVLPLLFGALERIHARPGGRPVAVLGALVALQFYAGYPQVAEMGLLAAAAWVLYRARAADRPLAYVVRAAGGVALGIGLAAVQLLPFLEYLRESAVLAYRTQWMRFYALPFRAAITLLMPDYYGSPITGDFWGATNFNELTTSAGLLPWIVLPVALVAAWSRPGTKFFTGVAVVALVMIYRVPGVAPALAAVPPFSLMITTRLAFLLVFALCALLALGLDRIARGSPPGARVAGAVRVTFVALTATVLLVALDQSALIARAATRIPQAAQLAMLVVVLGLATLVVLRLMDSPQRWRWWVALVTLQLAGALPLAATYNGVIQLQEFYPVPPALRHLADTTPGELGRVWLTTGGTIQTGNVTALLGLSDAGGYDGMTPRRVEQLVDPRGSVSWSASDPINLSLRPSSPLFDLVGVRRVLVRPDAPPPAEHFVLDYEGADGRVYRNDRALPRAFVVFRARACVDATRSLQLVHSDAIDFREEAILAECDAAPLAGRGGRVRTAAVRHYASDRVVIETVTDAPGYLILTDAWFPGWYATVDGVAAPIRRANHALRAVWLDAGRHTVEFHYAPLSVRIGLGISLAALVLTLGLALASLRTTLGRPLTTIAVGALLAMMPGVAGAEILPPAPFSLSASPPTTEEGRELTLTLTAKTGARPPDTPVDLYVAVIQDGKFHGAYLTDHGVWTATPEPYRRSVPLREVGGLVLRFQRVNPAGWFTFRVYFVRAAAETLGRKHYALQPIDVTVRIEPAATGGRPRSLLLVGLLTVVAWVVVLLTPRRQPST